jgi:hypothetical protein
VQGMITFALWMGTFIHDGYIDQLFCRVFFLWKLQHGKPLLLLY